MTPTLTERPEKKIPTVAEIRAERMAAAVKAARRYLDGPPRGFDLDEGLCLEAAQAAGLFHQGEYDELFEKLGCPPAPDMAPPTEINVGIHYVHWLHKQRRRLLGKKKKR